MRNSYVPVVERLQPEGPSRLAWFTDYRFIGRHSEEYPIGELVERSWGKSKGLNLS